jgi:hypothetical protein
VRQHPEQRRQQRPIRWREADPLTAQLSLQDPDLMAQRQDLDLFPTLPTCTDDILGARSVAGFTPTEVRALLIKGQVPDGPSLTALSVYFASHD